MIPQGRSGAPTTVEGAVAAPAMPEGALGTGNGVALDPWSGTDQCLTRTSGEVAVLFAGVMSRPSSDRSTTTR